MYESPLGAKFFKMCNIDKQRCSNFRARWAKLGAGSMIR